MGTACSEQCLIKSTPVTRIITNWSDKLAWTISKVSESTLLNLSSVTLKSMSRESDKTVYGVMTSSCKRWVRYTTDPLKYTLTVMNPCVLSMKSSNITLPRSPFAWAIMVMNTTTQSSNIKWSNNTLHLSTRVNWSNTPSWKADKATNIIWMIPYRNLDRNSRSMARETCKWHSWNPCRTSKNSNSNNSCKPQLNNSMRIKSSKWPSKNPWSNCHLL